jgi:hypothetical protein
MAARLAAVRAEVADVGGVVRVRRVAANAVLRVRCVLERRTCVRRVVHAEAQHPLAALAERRDERIVGADDERRLGRQLRDGRPPALGDVLELP